MNNMLIQDTIRMLQQEVSPDTLIRLNIDEYSLEEMASLLHTYKLTRTRRTAVLGCYILISSAIRKHQELSSRNTRELTKNILDGDYLFGLYYQRLVEQKEFHLLRYLVPAHKRMQIGLIEGRSLDTMYAEITAQIQQYLDQECITDEPVRRSYQNARRECTSDGHNNCEHQDTRQECTIDGHVMSA